ncbi:hypothetical protein F503_03883 [Ophiostoma piceae UAMH 11346]|uniref:Uncharacterized protein n=1 Tax=Ophiostoma piceae (strain UAMH 11346) TaxID=1262450 RepID=S3CG77_OPHP1|nr:hypothetical protein F503_03883 [Ophiostoma piceae UAMH 11346]
MYTFSNTMPRLFGRAPTPTPAAPSASASTPQTYVAPTRAKLVRRSHMTLASSAAPLASRGSMASIGSVAGMPPPSPSSSASFGRPGPGPGQGPMLETHREGSIVSASASAYEGLLNEHDRSSLYSIGSGQHQQHSHARAHAQNSARHPSHYIIRSQRNVQRAWLSAADARQSSWSGERPPPRKLVKDPNGSARPTASRELVDEDDLRHNAATGSGGGGGGGSGSGQEKSSSTPGTLGIRRKMARWRDLRW